MPSCNNGRSGLQHSLQQKPQNSCCSTARTLSFPQPHVCCRGVSDSCCFPPTSEAATTRMAPSEVVTIPNPRAPRHPVANIRQPSQHRKPHCCHANGIQTSDTWVIRCPGCQEIWCSPASLDADMPRIPMLNASGLNDATTHMHCVSALLTRH